MSAPFKSRVLSMLQPCPEEAPERLSLLLERPWAAREVSALLCQSHTAARHGAIPKRPRLCCFLALEMSWHRPTMVGSEFFSFQFFKSGFLKVTMVISPKCFMCHREMQENMSSRQRFFKSLPTLWSQNELSGILWTLYLLKWNWGAISMKYILLCSVNETYAIILSRYQFRL